MASKPIRWGFVGTGNIAKQMAQQLARLDGAQREAVCSASGKPAIDIEADRARLGFARALSVEDLVTDHAVDVVYVASANTSHHTHCLAALRAGKHVLCEKPLTMTVEQAEQLFAESARTRALLMDGTFSAYLPACDFIRDALSRIGPLKEVQLHKKIRMSIMDSSPIIQKRSLGGGIFDGTGAYTAHMLCLIFGAAAVDSLRPEDLQVESSSNVTGEVDWTTTVLVRIGGLTVCLTHRAADNPRKSFVRGERGILEFELPRVQDVFLDGVRHDTGYGLAPEMRPLATSDEGAPKGLHPGLGVEAQMVHWALSNGCVGPGVPQLSLEVMRAMVRFQELVRRRIPTHVLYHSNEASRL